MRRITIIAYINKVAVRSQSYIIVINDLAQVMPGTVQPRAIALRDTWRGNWEELDKDGDAAIDRLDQDITKRREATLDSLRSLR